MRQRYERRDERISRPGLFEERQRPSPVPGGWWGKEQHPDSATKAPYIVPGEDPRRYDWLRELPEPLLDIVAHPAAEVFSSEPRWATALILTGLAVGAYVVAEVLRLFAADLTTENATPFWLLLLVGVPAWARWEKARLGLALSFALIVPVTFVVALLLGHAATAVNRVMSTAAALAVAAVFVDYFTNHAVRVLLCTSVLPVEERCYFRKLWDGRWGFWIWPHRSPLSRAERRARRAMVVYAFGFSLLFVVLGAVDRKASQLALSGVSLLAGCAVALPRLLWPGPRRLAQLFGGAVRGWVEYGAYGSFAPGVMQSPGGARRYRLAFFALTLVLLAGTLVPPLSGLTAQLAGARVGPIGWTAMVAGWMLLSIALPVAVLVGLIGAVSLPVLGALATACDGPEDERHAATWSFVVHTLRTSTKELHREQLLWGFHATAHYPVLVPMRSLQEHIYVAGGSGTGKTSRTILPLALQLLAARKEKPPGPLLVVDLKGDNALFQAVRAGAREAKRAFRFFTNHVGYATHAFNPFAELHAAGVPLERAGETLLSALNLEHGAGYGRSHFSAVSRGQLRSWLQRFPNVQSISELHREIVRSRSAMSPAQKRREEESYELFLALEMLAEMPELNVTEGAAFDERIAFTRSIRDNEVVYFSLSPKPEEAAARFVGSLAVETFYAALTRHNTAVGADGKQLNVFKRAHAVLDEFQVVAGRNFEAFMETARSNGLGLILASQVPAKLEEELRVVVEANVAIRQYFSIRSVAELHDLRELGGTTMELGEPDGEGNPRYRSGPRLSENILRAVSGREDLSVLIIQKSADFAQFDSFPIVVRSPHCQSKKAHAELLQRSWPTGESLLVVGEAAAPGTGRDPFARSEAASPAGPQPVAPAAGTELEASFARIVVSDHGYEVSDDISTSEVEGS